MSQDILYQRYPIFKTWENYYTNLKQKKYSKKTRKNATKGLISKGSGTYTVNKSL